MTVSSLGNVASGRARWKTTSYGALTSTPARCGALPAVYSAYPASDSYKVELGFGVDGWSARSKERLTSAAVTSLPS